MNASKFLTKLAPIIVIILAFPHTTSADIRTLTAENTGYYWYQRQNWMGGSDTQSGFSLGDSGTGLLHAQRLYYYYGGADRYWEQKHAYIQISLQGLSVATLQSASLWIYVVTNDSPVSTSLNHVSTQSPAATGDASQQLPGDTNVVSSSSLAAGWNQIDITSFVLSDLGKSYSYAAFNMPSFDQSQDENRIISFYGASTDVEIDGASVKPYFEVQMVPEPGILSLLVIAGMAVTTATRRVRRKI